VKIRRKKTRQVRIGNVKVGGNAPVSIQSMAKTRTSDARATIGQVKRLKGAGCEIVRVAVKNSNDIAGLGKVVRAALMPVVADIHFDYWLAILSIKNGADKIRINPGNIKSKEELKAVVKAAKRAKTPVRIGVNSGSVGSQDMVTAAKKTVRLFFKK